MQKLIIFWILLPVSLEVIHNHMLNRCALLYIVICLHDQGTICDKPFSPNFMGRKTAQILITTTAEKETAAHVNS